MNQKSTKIRIIKDNDLNPQIQPMLQQKFYNVQAEIENQGLSCAVEAVEQNDQTNFQRWKFSFKGKENITRLVSKLVLEDGKLVKQLVDKEFPSAFKDKCITGILDFPGDYPNSPPKFTFDPINGETIQHLNIYGGGLFCVPLFTSWKKAANNLSELQILQTIEHIFHNPNVNDPANPTFGELEQEQQYQTQLRQAQILEDYDV